MKLKFLFTLAVCNVTMLHAQQPALLYYRPNDQRGLNIFETTKEDTILFTGLKVRVGGNFTQDFQALQHENDAATVPDSGVNLNELAAIHPGFNLPMANLLVNAQLADGIRMNLTVYLSTRHHEESWVKGGYVQFDKLSFLKSGLIDSIMKKVTLTGGFLEVDYGDQHFRRTDGGNSIYNPFVENYIMDEFATELGGEIYYHSGNGFLAMGGITNGQLNPTVLAPDEVDSATGKLNVYAPAFHGKLGYDRQVNDQLRVRLTGSAYSLKSTSTSTLFHGDRAGSHYFYVQENTLATASDSAWSGRYNPYFTDQVTAFMINPFIKFHGLELFGTYEISKGRMISEKDKRMATQWAVDVIYRFTSREKFWVAFRYNAVNGDLPFDGGEIKIDRIVGSVGWFLTKNIMLKAEYVNQVYRDYPFENIHSEGSFNGIMAEASIGF